MKKTIYYAAFAAILSGNVLTSCESDTKKVEDAKENVEDANKELVTTQKELNKEYPAFKTEAEQMIEANEKRIAELKEKLSKPRLGILDENRKKRIAELEQRNAELRNKLVIYEKDPTDWESFKSEFKHDMDGLSSAIEDVFTNNKK